MHSPQQGAPLRADPRRRGLAGPPGRREGLLLGLALALLSCLPFLVVVHPQLTDYPSHLARYYVMLDEGRSPFLDQYYHFQWRWMGNLGADILIWPLAKLFGLETAGWVIGLILPPLTALGLIAVEWQLRGRVGIGTLLAFALIWSPAMELGFYNFCLALAMALLAFALWIRLEGWRWRGLLFLPIGLAVWVAHVSGWGVLGILVFGYEFSRRKGLPAFLAPWPLLLPLIPMLAFTGETDGALAYGKKVVVYKAAIWLQSMRDQWFTLDWISLALVVLALAAAWLRRRFDGRLGWAALILSVLTIVMPRHFGGGDYADYRLIAVALMVGCLAIDWSAPRWLLWMVPLLFLTRLAVTTDAWHRNSRELELALKAIDYLPQGARVAGAVLNDAHWNLSPFEHAPSYATIRRDALVNTHFAIPGVHMLQLKQGGTHFVDPWHRVPVRPGGKIDLAAFEPLEHADYVWYFGDFMPTVMPAGATVLYRTRMSFLARLANTAAAR